MIDNITLLIAFVGFLFAMILMWAFPKIECWFNTYLDEQDIGDKKQ